MVDTENRLLSLTEMSSFIASKLIKLRDGFTEKKTILIHDVAHHNWHPMVELKRLQFHKNVRKELVPKPTWEPGIEAGYRPPYKPWKYYFISLFQWHNETINVWTHLIGTLVIALYMFHFNQSMDYLNNPRAWPHFLLGICSMICTSASCVAHLLHSKSAYAHYVTLSFDYAGAGIYALSVSASVFFYSSDDRIIGLYFIRQYFLAIATILCAIMCLGCCYGKVKYSLHHHLRRKLWFVLPTVPPYAMTLFISFPRYISEFFLHPNPDPVVKKSWYLHLNHLISFTAATFFFIAHVPEIFAHGEFDMIGQGHQLWHVLLVCTMVFQLYALQFDYDNRTHNPDIETALPPYETCFYALAVLIMVDLICIYIASKTARVVVKKERQELETVYNAGAAQNPKGSKRAEGDEFAYTRTKILRNRTVVIAN